MMTTMSMSNQKLRAILYCRCSTDEKRQDVKLQLEELERYCKREGWVYDVQLEYSSGSKSVPDKLRRILRLIRSRHYQVFLTFDLSRFSRLHPTTTGKMMDFIVGHKCRFISVQDNIDSDDEIKWLLIKPMFQYLSWIYSRNLSEKVKMGMEKKSKEIFEKGFTKSKKTGKKIYSIGRPKGSKDKKLRSKKGYYKRHEEKLPF